MKSGWFWGTAMWQEYLAEYAKMRPECLDEFKSSPLADDHDFSDAGEQYSFSTHQSQVIDLNYQSWSDVRESYHSLIHRATKQLKITSTTVGGLFPYIHRAKFGTVRNDATYNHQRQWIRDGYAMLVVSYAERTPMDCDYVSAVLWITYKGCAYYASSPSLQKNIQHAIVWKSFDLLRERGIRFVDMGQIDGEEASRGVFKTGFGGEAEPFTIVRKLKHPGRAL